MFSFPRVTCPSTGGMFQQGSTQGHTSPGRATLLLLPICAIAFVCGLAVGNWHASPPVLAASQRGWVIGATAITDVRSLPRNLGQSLLPLQLKETRKHDVCGTLLRVLGFGAARVIRSSDGIR